MSPTFPPANRPFALPTLEMIADAATAAARDAIEHDQPMLLSRAQFAKLAVDKFDQVIAAHESDEAQMAPAVETAATTIRGVVQ